jgi:hypothetical protein
VLRTDSYLSSERTKVVKVFLDMPAAEAEVERLTALNGPKGSTYEMQVTHVFGRVAAIGRADEADPVA